MSTREDRRARTQKQILWFCFLLAVVAVLFFLQPGKSVIPTPTIETPPPEITLTPPATPSPTLTIDPPEASTSMPSPTPTATHTATPTFTSFPTATIRPYSRPIPGTVGENLPPGFTIGPWHDNSCDKAGERFSVKIRGLEISGGTRPYSFTFWQYGEIIATRFSGADRSVEFQEPVVVKKGVYVHVLVSFNWRYGNATWEDDLYYRRGRRSCPGN